MVIEPTSPAELACALASAPKAGQLIALRGRGTKDRMGGPLAPAEITLSTARLTRLLQYEPKDLTVSVEAGMPFAELSRLLAENRQMLPLDPPFADTATVGGVLATNSSGPRRRLYGTARDMVIGMTFATLEGKLVPTGGMVVKNVAGLDMAKLLIGSFGTLAAIATVNFKVFPMPAATRTFVGSFTTPVETMAARDRILQSVLQPVALDALKRAEGGYQLFVQAAGSEAVLDRYQRELIGFEVLDEAAETDCWRTLRDFTAAQLASNPGTAVARVSCTLDEVGRVLNSLPAPALARAGNGVCYGYFADAEQALGRGVLEFAPDAVRARPETWPSPGNSFAMMEKVKAMFDPSHLLNRGRLYARI